MSSDQRCLVVTAFTLPLAGEGNGDDKPGRTEPGPDGGVLGQLVNQPIVEEAGEKGRERGDAAVFQEPNGLLDPSIVIIKASRCVQVLNRFSESYTVEARYA